MLFGVTLRFFCRGCPGPNDGWGFLWQGPLCLVCQYQILLCGWLFGELGLLGCGSVLGPCPVRLLVWLYEYEGALFPGNSPLYIYVPGTFRLGLYGYVFRS